MGQPAPKDAGGRTGGRAGGRAGGRSCGEAASLLHSLPNVQTGEFSAQRRLPGKQPAPSELMVQEPESCCVFSLLLFKKCQRVVTDGVHLSYRYLDRDKLKLFPMAEVPAELPKTENYCSTLPSFFPSRPGQTDSLTAPRHKVWGVIGFSRQITTASSQESRFPSRSTDGEKNHRPSPSLLARLRGFCQPMYCKRGSRERVVSSSLRWKVCKTKLPWGARGVEKAHSSGEAQLRPIQYWGEGVVYRHRPNSCLNEQSPRGGRPLYCPFPKEHRGK